MSLDDYLEQRANADSADEGEYQCDDCIAGDHDSCEDEDCACRHPEHSSTIEEYDEMVDLQLEREAREQEPKG